jgi:hypothetical protein
MALKDYINDVLVNFLTNGLRDLSKNFLESQSFYSEVIIQY